MTLLVATIRRWYARTRLATLSPDTDPRAEAVMIAGFRRMRGAERLARVCALRESALALARVRIEERHGHLPEREIRLRLASLWLDAESMRAAFDWDPREKGY